MSDLDRIVLRLRAAGCVFAEDEAAILLGSASGADLERLVGRRVAGEPLEHLVGRVRFGGLDLLVGPGVFVPRQRTAYLAELATGLAAAAAARHGRPLVVDLCCGCGAIGAVVAHHVPGARVVAADVDPDAVALARLNLAGRDASTHTGDLFDALPPEVRGGVDVLAANVPYVPSGGIATLPPEARDHEPRVALDGGPDGLDVARRVAAGAAAWLAPGGTLLVEVGTDQVDAAEQVVREAGLSPTTHTDDERGATVVCGARGVAFSQEDR